MLILLFLKDARIMGLSARDATPAWRVAVSNLWMESGGLELTKRFFSLLSTKSHSDRKNDGAEEICGGCGVAKRDPYDYIGPNPCEGKRMKNVTRD